MQCQHRRRGGHGHGGHRRCGGSGAQPGRCASREKTVAWPTRRPWWWAATSSCRRCKPVGPRCCPSTASIRPFFSRCPTMPLPGPGGWKRSCLTASGGPFRQRDPATLSTVTPDEACAHPNWVMGRKISVDSATMMNKALEVIEASYLFGLKPGADRGGDPPAERGALHGAVPRSLRGRPDGHARYAGTDRLWSVLARADRVGRAGAGFRHAGRFDVRADPTMRGFPVFSWPGMH